MPLRLLHFVSLPYCSPKLWIYRVGQRPFPSSSHLSLKRPVQQELRRMPCLPLLHRNMAL